MNGKRFVLACLAVFIFIFLSDWLLHGIILMKLYAASSNLWRPQDQMKDYMAWLTAGQFFTSIFFCLIFTKGYQNRGIGEGIRYGLLMGLFFVPHNLITYAVQPLPEKLVAGWIVGEMCQAIGAGIVLAAVYRPKQA